VVETPAFDDGPGLSERGEDLFIQGFVAQSAVKALVEAVLLGLSGAM
jgi:hypothetical protein